MGNNRLATLFRGLFCLAFLCLLCLAGQQLIAQGTKDGKDEKEKDAKPAKANVFTYPEKLTARDKLVDGPAEKASEIEIKSETTLIWVDLAPDYRFAHATEYVLITAQGARVVKGSWWPVLNGKPLFRDTKAYNAEFPIKLTQK